MLEDAGAIAIKLPTIDICYLRHDSLDPDQRASALRSNCWIFTSVNAVIGAVKCKLIPVSKHSGHTHRIVVAAIGQATGDCLAEHGITVDRLPPENSGTEQFLAFCGDQFNSGDVVTIIRGDDGRNVLKERLESKGCDVSYLGVYCRQLPPLSADSAAETVEKAIPCAISVTSDLGLSNLLELLPVGFHPLLFNCPLVVNSARCAELARNYGFIDQILVATPPGDNGQLKALTALNT